MWGQGPTSKYGCEDKEQWWWLLWLWFWCSKWCSWSWNIGWMLISSLQIYLKVGEESRISCLWLKILWSWGLVSSKSDAIHRAREREYSARADLSHMSPGSHGNKRHTFFHFCFIYCMMVVSKQPSVSLLSQLLSSPDYTFHRLFLISKQH